MEKFTFVNPSTGLEKIEVDVLLCEAKIHLQFCQGGGSSVANWPKLDNND